LLFSDWSKKQKILIGALTGVMLILILVFVVLVSRASSPAFDTDEPDGEEILYVGEGVVSNQAESTPPPDLVLEYRPDPHRPLPENGAVLRLGEAYTIGGTILSN
jgi:hypothetical protein